MTPDAKAFLLAHARAAVAGKTDETQVPHDASLPGAAFVSLHTRDAHALRGCIGTFAFDQPLVRAVERMARAAAFEDPRFPPVRPEELAGLTVEISALTPPHPITPEAVEVGKHGLLISRGFQRGVLLPQVAIEWGWDREQFLMNTCRKAGLPDDAWKQPGTRLEAFEAEVFREDEETRAARPPA